jgi:hypothetical protein
MGPNLLEVLNNLTPPITEPWIMHPKSEIICHATGCKTCEAYIYHIANALHAEDLSLSKAWDYLYNQHVRVY